MSAIKNFLGKGFSFPLNVNGRGNVELSSDVDNIEAAVRVILGTAKGERLMRPDFGCEIHDLVFHPVNANTCAQVSLYVNMALLKWEHRIEDIDVESYPDPTSENTILVTINYRVRSTNKMTNLVYPFFLRREQDL